MSSEFDFNEIERGNPHEIVNWDLDYARDKAVKYVRLLARDFIDYYELEEAADRAEGEKNFDLVVNSLFDFGKQLIKERDSKSGMICGLNLIALSIAIQELKDPEEE